MPHRFGCKTNLNAVQQNNLLEKFSSEFSPFVELAKRIGVANMNAVLETLGGEKPHVPKPASFWRGLELEVRNEEIRARFRGNNLAELALEYGIEERQLRNIVAGTRYVRHASKQPPRSIKLSEAQFVRVHDIAMQRDVSLRVAHDALIAIALSLPDLPRRLSKQLGATTPRPATGRTTAATRADTAHA